MTTYVAKNHKNRLGQPFWSLDIDFCTQNCLSDKFEHAQKTIAIILDHDARPLQSALPVLKRFFLVDDGLELKVQRRGSAPGGGGQVLFICLFDTHLAE